MRIHSYFGSKIAAALTVGLCALLSAGCTRRVRLTPEELLDLDRRIARYEQRVAVDPNTKKEELFVYTHRRFIVKYEASTEIDSTVGRNIYQEVEKRQPLVFIIRSRAGQIIAREENNGVPLLWVSFDKCDSKDCAFGFVRTEDNLHKLVFVPPLPGVPPREGFKVQSVYRRYERPRNVMKKAKIAALGEANEVYVVKRKRRVKTVFLDVRKRIREKELREIEVKEGR